MCQSMRAPLQQLLLQHCLGCLGKCHGCVGVVTVLPLCLSPRAPELLHIDNDPVQDHRMR